jgi:hypothetical protein
MLCHQSPLVATVDEQPKRRSNLVNRRFHGALPACALTQGAYRGEGCKGTGFTLTSLIQRILGSLKQARACVAALGTQLLALKAQILAFDRRIMTGTDQTRPNRRLDEIPGVGPAISQFGPGPQLVGPDMTRWDWINRD